MTKAEYAAYETAVDQFFTTEGIERLTSDDDEPGFSWQPCSCCQRPEGGDRYNAQGLSPVGVHVGYSICSDCLYYTEYGRLDDSTMLALEAQQ